MFNLQDQIPRCLDDIIKKNKEELKLEYVQLDYLSHLNKSLPITNLKGILEDAFLYKRIIQGYPIQHTFLVGFLVSDSGKNAYHTSPIKQVDLATSTVLTNSGSHYIIQSMVSGDPAQELLLHICQMAHRDGWGQHFGVLEVFY